MPLFIPKDFEKPFLFRTTSTVFNFSVNLARFANALKIGSEISNFRKVLGVFTSIEKKSSNKFVNIEEKSIANVKVRVYSPKAKSVMPTEYPTMVFIHGGAYIFGSLDSYDLYLMEFVKQLDMIVISVDYRLAPEHPHPTPTNDCYDVLKSIIENPKKHKIDMNKLVLAGDSAGGNAVCVLTQRLLAEGCPMPEIQILIYPWTQLLNVMMPSNIQYLKTSLIGTKMAIEKVYLLYLGIQNPSDEVLKELSLNNHMGLIGDAHLREKIKSYLNVDLIPHEYKMGKRYYDKYADSVKVMYPERVNDASALGKNAELAEKIAKLYDPSVSPLFADEAALVGLPKAYFVLLEWDALKDEGLLYAERLKRAGVECEVKFYEKAFHGIASLVDKSLGYQKARDMQRDLIEYLRQNL